MFEVETMTRMIPVILAFSLISRAEPPSKTVEGAYHFTTPQTDRSLQEAATVVRTVAAIPQLSVDASADTLTFSGPAEMVDFAEWLLPRIDKIAGDDAIHEYGLPSGDIGRVIFVPNVQTPQALQELVTILRTVADVQKLFTFSANHAIVLRGPGWQVAFAAWIIDQINQSGQQQKPDKTPREFTVGGPDFRGLGHGARVNFLIGTTSQQQAMELLTVLRTVGDIQKVFSYTASHALVLRAGDSDLQRAEWIIQRLDLPAGQVPGGATFTASTGDDVTRTFQLRNAAPQSLQAVVTGLRSDLNIRKVFSTTTPAYVVVRGTTDQIAAAMTWMTAHNALFE
jgi:hypothetical protein